jgi:hypothetical protein
MSLTLIVVASRYKVTSYSAAHTAPRFCAFRGATFYAQNSSADFTTEQGVMNMEKKIDKLG